MRPEIDLPRCKEAVFVLGDAWRRDALQQVGGLTLLGRAILALHDYGVERFAFVGDGASAQNQRLVATALAGRGVAGSMLFLAQSSNPSRQIEESWAVAPDAPVLLLPEPILIGEHPDADVKLG